VKPIGIYIVGFLLLTITDVYSLNDGIRFYIEKDLTQLKQNKNNDNLKNDLIRLLDLCETNFISTDTTTAKVYHELSKMFYDDRDFRSALDFKKKELSIAEYHNCKSDLAEIYTRIGSIYRWLSSFHKTEEYHLKSLQVKKQIPDHTYAENYLELCNAYHQQGKYNLQKQYADYAIEVAKTPKELCEAYDSKLSGHARLGEMEEAYRMLDKLFEVARTNSLKALIGQAYTRKGWLKLMEKDKNRRRKRVPYSINEAASLNEAILLYKQGINLIEQSEDKFKDRGLAYNYSSLSNLFAKVGDYDRALEYSEIAILKARDFYKKDYDPDMGTLFANFAYKYLSRYNINYRANPNDTLSLSLDLNKGIYYQQEAVKCFLNNSKVIDPIEDVRQADLYGMDLKWRCIKSYSDIAISYAHKFLKLGRNTEDLIKAEKSQSKVIELIDIMREEMSDQDTKIFWRKETRYRYDTAIELSEWLGDIHKVLYYVEKSKSILLLDELNHKDALKLIPENLSLRERDLRELISNFSDEKPYYYNKYNEFLDSLKVEYPAYYAYKFDNEPPNILEIQNSILNDSTNLIMYHRTPDSLYTINITSTTSELLHQPNPKDFDAQVDALLSLVNNKDSLEYMSCYKNFIDISHSIYKTLIAPVEHKRKNTIIIGDGKIDFIPFDLLVTDTTGGYPRYMILDHVIGYTNSVSVLRNKKLKSDNKFNNLLMVCPERFDAIGLTSLTQSRDEINSLKHIVNSKVLENKEASIENFLAFSEQYDVIHFSSHSGLDKITHEPWIAFQDSLISLNEIYKLHLNASLVSLSSCKSTDGNYQSGDDQSGEGINSLARAFLFADASAVVGSLWNLNEVSGYTIFQDFYKNLKSNETKPEALRSAKIEFIKNNPYKSPYHWAPLICIGNPDPLHSNFTSNVPIVSISILGLLLMILLIYKFRP
jgi:CHAT domain-containing protein/tetratricopeptide (TPR) repeat protein